MAWNYSYKECKFAIVCALPFSSDTPKVFLWAELGYTIYLLKLKDTLCCAVIGFCHLFS